MRMRHKPNLLPRMEKCAAVQIMQPELNKGNWRKAVGYDRLYLELGCGKGRFTCDTAQSTPEVAFIAVEKIRDAMVTAMERAVDMGIANIRFIDIDANRLCELFDKNEIERIYINFCDPWPKSRDAKFRLTAPGFLRSYGDILPVGGEIHFKTDNTPLFDWSIEQFKAEGWELSELTHDLHAYGPVGIMTDYEAKFYADGLKINRLIAIKTSETKTTSAGSVARLRNSALTDARGYLESKEDKSQ